MSIKDETERTYREAFDRLNAVLSSGRTTLEEKAEAEAAIDELNRTKLEEILGNFEERTASLNALVQTLNRIIKGIRTDPTGELKTRLQELAARGRQLLIRNAAEAMPGLVPPEGPLEPDAAEVDDDVLAGEPPHKTDETDPAVASAPEEAPSRTSLPEPPAPSPERPRSLIPDPLRNDYERLFASCIIRPDKVGKLNWHLKKMQDNRDRYEAVGVPLGIPWWFIAAIQAMETGFRFERHLHNGDPLSDRTKRVPKGRPPEGEPPFTWEESARDALIHMKLHEWSDWSVPGALYKWEAYNGFGYRKHHPEVLSPYLWSYTNHYTKGKYVKDGEFDPEAVSKQCGTAAMLRSLINMAVVAL